MTDGIERIEEEHGHQGNYAKGRELFYREGFQLLVSELSKQYPEVTIPLLRNLETRSQAVQKALSTSQQHSGLSCGFQDEKSFSIKG